MAENVSSLQSHDLRQVGSIFNHIKNDKKGKSTPKPKSATHTGKDHEGDIPPSSNEDIWKIVKEREETGSKAVCWEGCGAR